MLYIRNFNITEVKGYYAVPTRPEEVNEGLALSVLDGYMPHINRVFAACVVNCNLATVMGASAKDTKGAIMTLPVIVKTYLAKSGGCEPYSKPFEAGEHDGRRLLISDVSFQSGTNILVDNNPISSAEVRRRLNELNSKMKLPVINQFANIVPEQRFLDKETGERLVFVDNIDTPYNKQMVYVIDHRSFTTSIVEGIARETLKPANPISYIRYYDEGSDIMTDYTSGES